jgi:hypothetical protein
VQSWLAEAETSWLGEGTSPTLPLLPSLVMMMMMMMMMMMRLLMRDLVEHPCSFLPPLLLLLPQYLKMTTSVIEELGYFC